MFAEHNEPDKAIEIIEEGISEIPDSAVLNVYLAMAYLDRGDYRQAEIFLKQAERIEPDAPYVQMLRGILQYDQADFATFSSQIPWSEEEKEIASSIRG